MHELCTVIIRLKESTEAYILFHVENKIELFVKNIIWTVQ